MSAAGVFLGIGSTLLVSAVIGITGCGKKSQPKTKTKEELLAGGADPDARLMMYHTYKEAKQN